MFGAHTHTDFKNNKKIAERLRQEKERRYLESIPETIRVNLIEYLSKFENVE